MNPILELFAPTITVLYCLLGIGDQILRVAKSNDAKGASLWMPILGFLTFASWTTLAMTRQPIDAAVCWSNAIGGVMMATLLFVVIRRRLIHFRA